MNDKLVVMAPSNQTVRAYKAEGDYSCTGNLDWLQVSWVNLWR
jgi:hypothetical protein